MIKHIWSIACNESIINSDDNSLSINKVFEGMNVVVNGQVEKKKFKTIIPINYEIVSFLTRMKNIDEDEKINIKIEIINPEFDKIGQQENLLIFQNSFNKLRARVKINGFPVDIPGIYNIIISIKNEKEKTYKSVSELPIDVIIEYKK